MIYPYYPTRHSYAFQTLKREPGGKRENGVEQIRKKTICNFCSLATFKIIRANLLHWRHLEKSPSILYRVL